jgi:hypothetical protein
VARTFITFHVRNGQALELLKVFLNNSLASKAFVQKPAPAFETMAVVGGQFKKVSLSQFKGTHRCSLGL